MPSISPLTSSATSVPAPFVLGDSSVDCSTNNFLGTFAHADRLPYCRDFVTHQPTGKFSDGKIPVDFIALHLVLPFLPNCLELNGSVEDMLHGVNYASAGAGIIFSSGSELGQHVSLTQQIQQCIDTVQQFILQFGEAAAGDHISRSVFYISIEVNDYIHYYLRNVSDVQYQYLPWTFNQFLASSPEQEVKVFEIVSVFFIMDATSVVNIPLILGSIVVKNLYNLHVRRAVVMGLPPIGCAPHYLRQYDSEDGGCTEEINDAIMGFNFAMRFVIDPLCHELPDVNIVYCNIFHGSMDNLKSHEHYSFNITSDACCRLGKYIGWIMCLTQDMACDDASNFIWWDQFHLMEAVNKILADNVWDGRHTRMCYPMNLEEMVRT